MSREKSKVFESVMKYDKNEKGHARIKMIPIIASLDAKLKTDKFKEVIDRDTLEIMLKIINALNNAVNNGRKDKE